MAGGRDYDEDVAYWAGWIEDPEFRSDDPMLNHLTDQEILGLADCYDDRRIDAITRNYVELRQRLRSAMPL